VDDLESLRSGAAKADAVVHTAYNHAFTDYGAAAQQDRDAIQAMADALVGSDRSMVIVSGCGLLAPGRLATEDSVADRGSYGMNRFASEEVLATYLDRGVRGSVVRFPTTVHGRGDHNFIPMLIKIAREKGVSAYPGEGGNRWAAVHKDDAAHLLCMAIESAPAGARLHGVAEEGIPVREIAGVIGKHLGVPVQSIPAEQAEAHWGWLGVFYSLDSPASSAKTRQLMGWQPTQPGLIADLEEGHYFSG